MSKSKNNGPGHPDRWAQTHPTWAIAQNFSTVSGFGALSSPSLFLSFPNPNLPSLLFLYECGRSDRRKRGETADPIGTAGEMFPKDWTPPCGSCCTKKYAALVQIPWRVFCKKGCDADGETWDECISECNEICYKDPVLKDYNWSSYIDRSPGDDDYSLECFHACVSGCGFKFETPPEKVEQVQPNRPPKPAPPVKAPRPHVESPPADDIPGTSA